MTAATSTAADPTRMAGPGWHADVYFGAIDLTIYSTATDDVLPHAVAALISPVMRRFWTVEWQREDDDGNDIYLLYRESPPGLSLL